MRFGQVSLSSPSLWACFGILLLGACISLSLPATPAFAQDEAADDAAADDAAADDVAADDAAPDNGGDAAPAADDSGDKMFLIWMFEALGWVYSPIFLFLSFTLVALFVMNLITTQRSAICPAHLVEGFEAHLNERRYQEAFELARSDQSFLGQVLAAGLGKLSQGYAQAIEAMQEVGEEENMKLEHGLSYLALIGSISPMVGLFGTVHGMIDSFSTIANSTNTPPPSKLAEGISTALFTTLVGLFLAIPAIVAYTILRNQVARLSLEVGIISEGLMSRFQTLGAGAQKPAGK